MFVIFAKVNRMFFIVYNSNFYFMEIKQVDAEVAMIWPLLELFTKS